MGAQYQFILFAVLALIAFTCYICIQNRQVKLRTLRRIRNQYGKRPEREYEFEEFDAITHYFERKSKTGFYIDDITWNDLDMDTIFMLLNQTYSCVGESYLYSLLRTSSFSGRSWRKGNDWYAILWSTRGNGSRCPGFSQRWERREKVRIFDYIYNLAECRPGSRTMDLVCLAAICAGAASIFLTSYGALLLLAALAFSWSTYYKEKKRMEPYIVSCKCFLEMLKMADRLASLKSKETEPYIRKIEEAGNRVSEISEKQLFCGGWR